MQNPLLLSTTSSSSIIVAVKNTMYWSAYQQITMTGNHLLRLRCWSSDIRSLSSALHMQRNIHRRTYLHPLVVLSMNTNMNMKTNSYIKQPKLKRVSLATSCTDQTRNESNNIFSSYSTRVFSTSTAEVNTTEPELMADDEGMFLARSSNSNNGNEGVSSDKILFYGSNNLTDETLDGEYDDKGGDGESGFDDEDDVNNMLTVCILGPPNAGKSTLFNRLICKQTNRSYRLNVDKGGRKGIMKSKKSSTSSSPNNKGRTASRLLPSLSSSPSVGINSSRTGTSSNSGGAAIVSPLPGTTRDTRECIGRIGTVKFRLYDTAGIDRYYRNPKSTKTSKNKNSTHGNVLSNVDIYTDKKWMMEQTIQAAQSSDLIVLLFDARNTIGTTPELLETARWLRKAVVGDRSGNATTTTHDRIRDNDNSALSTSRRKDHEYDFLTTGAGSPNTMTLTQTKKRVIVCGNKLEGTGVMPYQWEETLFDVTKKLGFGTVVPLSALHGDVGITEIGAIIDEMYTEKKKKLQLLHRQRESSQKIQTGSAIDTSTDKDTLSNNSDRTDDWFEDMDRTVITGSFGSNTIESLEKSPAKTKEKPLQLAILGRPNVGKSTLVNQLVQYDRVLTGPTPGLTRDAITIPFLWKGKRPVQIVDTAGIRKVKSRRTDIHTRTNDFILSRQTTNVHENQSGATSDRKNRNRSLREYGQSDSHDDQFQSKPATAIPPTIQTYSNSIDEVEQLAYIEEMAVADAIRALKVADVAVLVLDAQAGNLHKHELAICNAILQEGRALIIVANKMDILVRGKQNKNRNAFRDTTSSLKGSLDDTVEDYVKYTAQDYEDEVRKELESRFPILRKTPIIPMSSLTGEGVQDLLPAVFRARDRWERKISTGRLNQWLQDAVLSRHAPPPMTVSGNHHRPVRIKYIIQTKGRPPTFLLFCSGVGSSGGGSKNSNVNSKVASLPDSYIRYLIRNFQDAFDMYGMEIRFAVKNSNTKGNPYDKINPSTNTVRGVGGRGGRKKRMIRSLKVRGAPPSRHQQSIKRRRAQRNRTSRYHGTYGS